MFVVRVSGRQSKKRIPVIGVTGPIGSGKSSVAKMFGKWGGVVVSGDEIGRQIVERSPVIRRRLADAFGEDIMRSGQVDRALLASRAFASPERVLRLNRIVHPALIRELNRRVRRAKKSPRTRAVVIDAALLVEWSLGLIRWDHLVGVTAPYPLRVERLRARGLTRAQIRQFSRAQMPWRLSRAHCDAIVKNDSSLAILRGRARLCWKKLLLWELRSE